MLYGSSKEALQKAIEQLEQALQHHETWLEGIYRSLLCRLPPGPDVLQHDAHHHCQFGQWLYRHADTILRDHPSFAAIELAHRTMHERTIEMYNHLDACGASSPDSYDRFAAAMAQLRLESHQLLDELRDSLNHIDSLTGATSRSAMLSHLYEQHELVKRNATPSTIAMLDLDHFKRVNDRHGHQVGDQVLKRLARYILSNIRPYDRLFRYGGEEFLLSMPQTPLDSAAALAERLREEIARQPLVEIDDEAITVTVSFGVAELTAECEVETVIQRADQALYSAKRSGRNRVYRWSVDTPHDG